MTAEEFNKKHGMRLKEKFYGMALSNQKIIDYLDHEFDLMAEDYPNMTYSQIKNKWGYICVYLTGVPKDKVNELERRCNEINKEE